MVNNDYVNKLRMLSNLQGPNLYAFIGFIGPDDDDLTWLLILIFDY